jgi:hypothetical protein
LEHEVAHHAHCDEDQHHDLADDIHAVHVSVLHVATLELGVDKRQSVAVALVGIRVASSLRGFNDDHIGQRGSCDLANDNE